MAEYGGRLGGFGGSLKVNNVQALAANTSILTDQTLKRYIRPDIESDLVRDDTNTDDDIPIIDLRRLIDPDSSQEESDKLNFACETWGFFQVTSDKPWRIRKSFFRLPLEVKERNAQQPGSVEGYGQAFVVSEEQKLDWADMLYLLSRQESYKTIKFWPTDPPTFRETMDRYLLEIREVVHCLLRFMGKNLGLEPDRLTDLILEFQSFRMNYYPPCPYAKNVLGFSPHSDFLGLTLLLQVNQVQGLQIRRNGRWIPVKPLPGAFVANIGDILEMLTNGKYKSIEHRAVVHPSKERLSIAVFYSPSLDAVVGPLPKLVNGSKEYYKTLDMDEFMKLAVSSKLYGKGLLERLKLNSS